MIIGYMLCSEYLNQVKQLTRRQSAKRKKLKQCALCYVQRQKNKNNHEMSIN